MDSFSIQLYDYDFGTMIVSYDNCLKNSVEKVIPLNNVYCAIGLEVLIFNIAGITRYGECRADNARYVGENRIVTWHKTENTKLIELTDS